MVLQVSPSVLEMEMQANGGPVCFTYHSFMLVNMDTWS